MRLDDRATDLPAEEGARVVALGLLDEAEAAAAALAAGEGPEPLHDFRVAVRRLRSVLRSFRPWLRGAGGLRRRHERRLRRLAASTGEARDAEVQVAWLLARRGALPPAHLAGLDLAVARFEARRAGGPDPAEVAARFARAAARLRRRLGRYERRVAGAGEAHPPFGATLAALVAAQAASLAARLDAVRDAADREAVHRARIEGKRLRYLLEPLRGHPRADAGGAVRRLKRLQDLLGDLHDAHVLAEDLGDALADSAAERARALHAATLGQGGARERLRPSPRPGLLALVRLVRERRDALWAELAGAWRGSGQGDLAREVDALAAALGPPPAVAEEVPAVGAAPGDEAEAAQAAADGEVGA